MGGISRPFLLGEMLMILWALYLPFALLISLICYITNPIVVLFSDEDGELSGFWKLWQTHDNSLNPSDVTEQKQLPKFLCYDWPRHYEEWKGTTPELSAVGKERWFTTCIDSHWTVWERIQRYICRTYWVTRNCAYGWCFWVFGNTPGIFWDVVTNDDETIYVHEDVPYWWFNGAWKYKSTAPICKIGKWLIRREIFIGWKVSENARVDTRAMIATRISIRIKREE